MSDEDGLMVLCEPCARNRHSKCWQKMLTRRGHMVACACTCPRAHAMQRKIDHDAEKETP